MYCNQATPVKGLRVYATTPTAVHENKETTPTAQTDQNGFATLSWQNNFFLSAIYINDQLAVKEDFYPGGNKLIEIERSSPVPRINIFNAQPPLDIY